MYNPGDLNGHLTDWLGKPNGLPIDATLLVGASHLPLGEIVGRDSRSNAGLPRLWKAEQERVADRAAADRHVSEHLAMVSHELRNSLGAIRIAASLMKRTQRGPEAVESARLVIEHQAAQMARLIDDLLEVSLLEVSRTGGCWPRLRCERVDLRDVARHAHESVAAEIDRRDQRLAVTLPEAPVWLQADAGRLEQVLVNLLGNASKYTDDGGELRLSVEQFAGYAIVRVCDSGTGIARAVLPHVFEPFVQADSSLPRAERGIGIGLTVVRDLVELHHGRVSAASGGLGLGSEFTVHLPISQVGAF